MSSLKSAVAILANQPDTLTAEAHTDIRPGKLVLVTSTGNRPENQITYRVEAALDADFANGSMPA